MFNIGGTELILILIIAFLVVGPQDLPKVARAIGRAYRWILTMIEALKRETGFDELEQEFRDAQKEVQNISREVKQTVKEADIRGELQGELNEIKTELGAAQRDVKDSFKEALSSDSSENKPEKKPLGFKDFKIRNGYEKPEPEKTADGQQEQIS